MDYTSKIKCLRCNNAMTWAEQRRQFGRLIQCGFTPDQAKERVPRCQKCITIMLEEEAASGTPMQRSRRVRH
jgi:hypothetical protein